MASGATPRNSARKSLLNSTGLDNSVDQTLTSAYNNGEALRLLESSGIASGSSLGNSFCNHSDCNYQSGHDKDCNQRGQPVRLPSNNELQPDSSSRSKINYNNIDSEQSRQAMEHLQKGEQIESMSLEAQTLRLLPAYFIAEFIGTFLLVFIGDGAIAAYVFSNRQIDAFSVCLAFGVGAMIATYVCAKLSGAHLNPAATVAFALDKKLKWELVPVYIVAQYLGGFLAALLLFLNNSEAINAFDGGNRSAYGTSNSTGGVFATYPAPFVTIWGSIVDQIVGTAILLFALTALSDRRNLALEERFQPPIVALAIGLVCFAFSVNCGAIFNPARDLSPRLLTALFGYPNIWDPIDGTYWYLAGIIGPHIGAIIGVFAYRFLIGTALDASERHLQMVREAAAAAAASSANSTGIMDSKPTRLTFNNPHHKLAYTEHSQQHRHDLKTTPVQQRPVDVPDYGSSIKR